MSSLSTLNPGFRPSAIRVAVIMGFAVFLVALGFVVPFWIVLLVAAGLTVIAMTIRAVRAVRAASRKVDQILAEELPPIEDGW